MRLKPTALALIALLVCACAGVLRAADDAPPAQAAPAAATQPARAPLLARADPVLPDGLGVNIHFTDPKAGEMKMLTDAGVRVVRMDLTWSAIERQAGEYDFAAYDRLVAACDEAKVKLLFILDYHNKLYDDGLSPHTDAGRAAFAKWAAAAVQRYKGKGILWEMYNEPNIHFWKPRPNVDDYVKLAVAVGKAIRDVAPDEAYVGPATSTIDLPFLEKCFEGGLLDYWSAVTVHPYRQTAPETVLPEYRELRQLIRRHGPKDRTIPIVSGEWGYSVAWDGFDAERQGKYLPRQWLTNLYAEVPVSIWYDWKNDGPNPKEPEHNFGTVGHAHRPDADAAYEPKPAYVAMKALTSALSGYRYNKRLAIGDPATDFVLLFTKGDSAAAQPADVKLAVWTTAAEPKTLVIPASAGAFKVVDHLGNALPDLTADGNGLSVQATDAPRYVAPAQANEVLRLAAALERAPLDLFLRAGTHPWAFASLDVANPLGEPVRAIGSTTGLFEPHIFNVDPGAHANVPCRVYVSRDPEPKAIPLQIEFRERAIVQQWTTLQVTNALRVTPLPAAGGRMAVRVENPSGEAFEGVLSLTDLDPGQRAASRKVSLDAGERETLVSLPFQVAERAPYRFGLRLDDLNRNIAVRLPPAQVRPVDAFARSAPGAAPEGWRAVAEGDGKVAAEVSLAANAQPDLAKPIGGAGTLDVAYKFAAGHRFLRVEPTSEELKKVDGRPKALGVWVYGDGSGHRARARFADATGRTFQPDAGRVSWTGWRYVTFPLDGKDTASWGGTKDSAAANPPVQYPIRLDTVFLLDAAGDQPSTGTVRIASPVLVY